MSAVERARQALAWWDGKDDAKFDADTPVVAALRDLLAEIDAGHWVDARELAALGSDVSLHAPTVEGDVWEVLVDGGSCVSAGDTPADALRAAREAAR